MILQLIIFLFSVKIQKKVILKKRQLRMMKLEKIAMRVIMTILTMKKLKPRQKEDPTSLQLAWEVLELSKLICKEQLERVDN